jgi:hypothetical protein
MFNFFFSTVACATSAVAPNGLYRFRQFFVFNFQ